MQLNIFRIKNDSTNVTVNAYIQDEKILNKLFTELGPRMKERNGGYTRILKIGFRQGDAADMVILELVDYKLPAEEDKDAAKAKKAEPKAKAEKPAKKPAEKKEGAAKKAPAKSAAKPKAEKKAKAED